MSPCKTLSSFLAIQILGLPGPSQPFLRFHTITHLSKIKNFPNQNDSKKYCFQCLGYPISKLIFSLAKSFQQTEISSQRKKTKTDSWYNCSRRQKESATILLITFSYTALLPIYFMESTGLGCFQKWFACNQSKHFLKPIRKLTLVLQLEKSS